MTKKETHYPEGWALVVGGSGGIGSHIVLELAQQGVNLCLTYNSNAERAEDIASQARALGVEVCAAQMTLQDAGSVAEIIDKQVAQLGRLHTVFIATGYDIPQVKISDLTPELWQRVLRSDAEGVFNLIHGTLPHLRDGGGGSYVHISSAGLQKYPPFDILSVAPKAAIEELIKGVAKEEGPNHIRANSIAIGVIETGIFLRLQKEGVFDDNWVSSVKNALPLKRFGQPEEVARMAYFLGSDLAGYTTGQLIPVDGGYGL